MPGLLPFDENDLPLAIVHTYQISRKIQIIYTIALLLVIVSVATLSLISIPVNVKCRGVFLEEDVVFGRSNSMKNCVPEVSSADHKSELFPNQPESRLRACRKLMAYCEVRPMDIDMIKVGQKVSFHLDGFEDIKWGKLSGKVLAISDELVLPVNANPVFKVQCILDLDHLEINFVKVYLKQGMKFTAIFNIGARRLFFLSRSKEGVDLVLDDHKQKLHGYQG